MNIHYKKSEHLVPVMAGSFMTFLSWYAWKTTSSPLITYTAPLGILLFSSLTMHVVLNILLTRRPAVSISPEGIYIHLYGFMPWECFSQIAISRVGRQSFISLLIKDFDLTIKNMNKISQFNMKISKSNKTLVRLPKHLNVKDADLIDAIEKHAKFN